MDFKLPDLGENIDSADIVRVLVNEGDTIAPNTNVFEIESGKASLELPCPHGGKITKLHVKAGDSVPIGGTLLSIEGSDAAKTAAPSAPAPAAAPSPAPSKAEQPAAPQPVATQQPAPQQPATIPSKPAPSAQAPAEVAARKGAAPAGANGGTRESIPLPSEAGDESDDGLAPAGPATRRLARELGIEISEVTGTGPNGRITREDVINAVREHNLAPAVSRKTAAAPAATATKPAAPAGTPDNDPFGPVRRNKLTGMRKAIAANMTRSSQTIPQLTNFDDADITELEAIRKGSSADYVGSDVKLTMMAFVCKAVALSLKRQPIVNSSIDLENDQIIHKEYVNLGIAVDTEKGLLVPVIRNADQLTIPQIARELTSIAGRARAGQVSLDEMRGGTFTISNLGAIGGTYSTPIINPPESAILLVGRSRKMPVVVDDEIKIRLMMPLSLTYDHRTIDGAAASRFMNEVIGYLHNPTRLLLAP